MDIESSRILLATMIAAIPTVMTLSLMVLFAFPRSNLGWIRKRHLPFYYLCLGIITFIFIYSIFALLDNLTTLTTLDSFYNFNEILGKYEVINDSQIIDSLNHSVLILLGFPGVVLLILYFYGYLEKER